MGHGKRGIVLQNVGSTLSPNKRCAKSNRPNGVQSQLVPPAFILSPLNGKVVLRHHLSAIPCMPINSGGVTTKTEPFPPLKAEPFLPLKADTLPPLKAGPFLPLKAEPFLPLKAEPFPTLKDEPFPPLKAEPFLPLKAEPFPPLKADLFQPLKAEPLPLFKADRVPLKAEPFPPLKVGPFPPLKANHHKAGPREQKMYAQEFEYYMKKDHPSGSKANRQYFDLRERRSVLDKRPSKRSWTQEAIMEGVDQYHWQQDDEKDIQDAVYRNYKGRLLVRKKDQAIKHLLEEKLDATPKKSYTHRKPKTQRRRRKSHKRPRKAEITDGVSETIRPRKQWNIRSRHHFRSFDHRRLRRKPKVFDFIFEKMKPCFKAKRTRSDSIGYDHFETDEQDAEHGLRVQEDVPEKSDAQRPRQPINEQSQRLVKVLDDATVTVTVEQSSVNVSVNLGLSELEVAAIETKVISEANTVLPDGALIHSTEEMISVQKMVVQKEDNFMEPAVVQIDQVTEYSDLWENLKSSSVMATKLVDVSEIPANHSVPPHPITEQAPRVLKKKNSRTGFDIYRDTNKAQPQIMGNQSRIPVSIWGKESQVDLHGILMDKQNVKPNFAKIKKANMYSKIPVAVESVQMCPAPQPTKKAVAQLKTVRSSGALTGRPGSNQENMTAKSTSGSHEVPKAAVKVKPRREANPRKKGIPPKKPFY